MSIVTTLICDASDFVKGLCLAIDGCVSERLDESYAGVIKSGKSELDIKGQDQ